MLALFFSGCIRADGDLVIPYEEALNQRLPAMAGARLHYFNV
jgi:hypothetical protein